MSEPDRLKVLLWLATTSHVSLAASVTTETSSKKSAQIVASAHQRAKIEVQPQAWEMKIS